MSSKLLQLSLYVVTVIQLTSSQSTYDVIQQENDVNSCGHTDQVLTQLVTTVSQLRSVVSQLQRDVAKIKTPGGKLSNEEGESRWELYKKQLKMSASSFGVITTIFPTVTAQLYRFSNMFIS